MASLSPFIPEWLRNMFSFTNDGFVYRNYYSVGQKGKVTISTFKEYDLYHQIPQLKEVIDRKASMFSNMDIKQYDVKTEKEIENPELQKLLQNPNILQAGNEWLRNIKQQEQVYGNAFIYKNMPSTIHELPVALWNVSPAYMNPILTGKLFDQTKVEDIISGYEYLEMGKSRKFEAKDILYLKLNDLDNPIIGMSPLMSLKFPLNNTKLAYEYRNVIMGQRGAPTIISSGYKDQIGTKSLTTEEKNEVEDAWSNDYGVQDGKRKVKVVSSPINVINNAFPTKELALFEEVDANMLTLVDHFGLNINIFSNKNATFENVKNAIIQTYQDTIQPEADLFVQSLGKFLNIKEGTKLVASYSHLSIMKENNLQGMDAIHRLTTAISQAVSSGILSVEQGRILLQNELATQLGEV